MNFNSRQKKVIEAKDDKIICLAGAATGKAIPVDTTLPTPNGPRQAKDIKIGDFLFSRKGKPTRVIEVYPQGLKEVYEVEFGDGRKAKCCNEHLWSVYKTTWENKNDFRTFSLNDLLKEELVDSSGVPYFYIPIAKAVEYKEKKYDIQPYLIGAGLNNNIIPEKYKYGSIEQRIELIRGLIDNKGSVLSDKEFGYNLNFITTNINLIYDIKEVLGSLGYVSTILTDNKQEGCNTNYILDTNIPIKEELFQLKRENVDVIMSMHQDYFYDRVSIKKISKLNYQTEMVCFEVDNDEHLFLMNDFIVTHNTRTLTSRIKKLIDEKVDPSQIVAITFTNLAAEEMRHRLGDAAAGAFIGTIHSYANKLCLTNGISTFELIDEEDFDKLLETAAKIPKEKLPIIDHLLIDESQDLSAREYFFLEHLNYNHIFYCGDIRQAIYGFKGCSDKYITNMIYDPDYSVYFLTENYRNAVDILNFANGFVSNLNGISPYSTPIKTTKGIIVNTGFISALDDLEQEGNWGNWFILARTNKEVELIQRILDDREIPNLTFKSGNLEGIEELSSVLKENKVKVLTIHSSKGMEVQNVIVVGALTYSEQERKLAYVAATRAMNKLYWCPKISKKIAEKYSSQKEGMNTRELVENDSRMIVF